MRISAIQPKIYHNTNLTKVSNTLKNETTNPEETKPVAFKSTNGAVGGFGLGMAATLAAIGSVAIAGFALPGLIAGGLLLGGGVAGAEIGNKITGPDKD